MENYEILTKFVQDLLEHSVFIFSFKLKSNDFLFFINAINYLKIYLK